MQVSKWGNSLAVRIPSSVVEALELVEGDEVTIRLVGSRVFEIARDQSRDDAIARLRALSRPLPPDWKFERDEANAR